MFNIAPLITRHHAEVNLGVNMHFLRNLPEGVHFDAFCKAVWAVLDGTTQSMPEKVDGLMDIIHQNAHLLSDRLVTRWLVMFPDEHLGAIIWNSFQKLEPSYDLSKQIESGSPQAWTIKQMLAVLKVLAPDQTKAFAALALEKYPNIYGYDSKNDCLAGLAKYLRYLAGGAAPERFTEYELLRRREAVKKPPTPRQEEAKTSDSDVADPVQRVQAMVLPGVTATGKLEELAANNAAARAQQNKNKKKKVA